MQNLDRVIAGHKVWDSQMSDIEKDGAYLGLVMEKFVGEPALPFNGFMCEDVRYSLNPESIVWKPEPQPVVKEEPKIKVTHGVQAEMVFAKPNNIRMYVK